MRINMYRRLIFFVTLLYCCIGQACKADYAHHPIRKAVPVWAKGHETEMNMTLGFRGVFKANKARNVSLKIAASTIYRVYVNGVFVGSGPARAAHGYFRVDEYNIRPYVKDNAENVLAIEVAGYNVNTYYTLDQPSFLQAELEKDGNTVLATGSKNGFEMFRIDERVQKVERYSFQRPFTEYYRMKEGYDKWRISAKIPVTNLPVSVFPPVKLLSRNVPMPEFTILYPAFLYSKGTVTKIKPEKYFKDRSLVNINQQFKGFPENELKVLPSQEIQEIKTLNHEIINKEITAFQFPLKQNEFYIYDFGTNYSGFIGAKIRCKTASRLIFHFDEMLTDNDVNQKKRMAGINNQIVYELEPGEYSLETIESYTFKFMKVILTEGDCSIEDLYIREFAFPENSHASFESSNPKLNRIFDAAKQSSRQNALDIFMDCPSRERAGWLCDSYYTAIMEKDFTGYSAVAHNFYENYAIPEHFDFLPDGMIPMCYPSDHNDGVFIPQWSLWFIMQVEDYARRGGDEKLVNQLKPRIEKLLKYFEGFENSDGLLEKLKGWKFVEWSQANNFTDDVSYPTNMLYSYALDCAFRLYGNREWAEKAEKIKQEILKQSFNGEFFVDNAVRKNGKLEISDNTTETCQYYAFFFGVATPSSHPRLLNRLITEFGPNRNDKVLYPKVFRSNAFMGNYLRMDILSRCNLQNQLITEIQDYFYSMAEKTGTLWEHMENQASCNHGFASYIGHVLYRDILGISNVDYINKEITVRFNDVSLDNCKGSMPIENDFVSLQWKRSGKNILYSLKAPDGYKVIIENKTTNIPVETTLSQF